jgi:hypothetical protein
VELNVFKIIWIASGSVLAIGWLIISFSPPSRNRTVIEWLSTLAMYAAILAIFVSLTLRMHAAGFIFGAWAVGLLSTMLFGGGLLVTVWKTVVALSGEKKTQSSATN